MISNISALLTLVWLCIRLFTHPSSPATVSDVVMGALFVANVVALNAERRREER